MADDLPLPSTNPEANTVTPDTAPAQEHTQTTALPPAVPDVLPPPEHERESKACRPDQTPWWKIFLEVGAFGLGIIFAFEYKGQLDEMRKATVAATRSADDSTNGVNLAQSANRVDQRAWVTVTPRFIKSKQTIVLNATNTGKTPALNYTIRASGVLAKQGDVPKASEQHVAGRGLIPPNGSFHSFMNGAGEAPKGKVWLVQGRIDYTDIFSVAHWTTFCYNLEPNGKGEFAPCDKGNEMDPTPRPKLLE